MKYRFILFLILQISIAKLNAQSGSFGNMFVEGGTEMTVFNIHNFQEGGTGLLPGIVGTQRIYPVGFFSFSENTSWMNASDDAFVDGYVKTYQAGPFIFPIGDNKKYRPAAVSNASFSQPAYAAYYGVSPAIAITSKVDETGNEPALPSGAPFFTDVSHMGNQIKSISNYEYWDLKGGQAAQITLSWDIHSEIGEMTENQLCLLSIVGWDANTQKWIQIPSNIDQLSMIDGSVSSVFSGTITTTEAIVPNSYLVYTLGSLYSMKITAFVQNSICFGDNKGFIQVNITDGNPPYSFEWSNNSTSSLLSEVAAGTYSVHIKDNLGCEMDTSFVISEPGRIAVEGSTDLCVGSTYTLTVTDPEGMSGIWSSDNHLVLTVDNTGKISTHNIGIAIVTYTNNSGCFAIAPLTVHALPDAEIRYPNSPYCTIDTAKVTLNGQTGGLFTAFPLGLSINNVTGEINLGSSIPNVYTIQYEFDNGQCQNRSSAQIKLITNQPPQISIGL